MKGKSVFTVLCLFDGLLMLTLFLLVGKTSGKGGLPAYWDATVVHYSFADSLFDITMISIVRGLLYSLCLIKRFRSSLRPLVVFITAFSTGYTIGKIVVFQFNGNQAMEYAFLIISLILPWLECAYWAYKLRTIVVYEDDLFVANGTSRTAHERTPLFSSERITIDSDSRPRSNTAQSSAYGTPPAHDDDDHLINGTMSDSEEFHDLASAADYFHSHSTQSQNESEPKGRERALTSEDMRLVSESGRVLDEVYTTGRPGAPDWVHVTERNRLIPLPHTLDAENMGITVERKSAKPVSLFRVIGILNADIQTVFDLLLRDIDSQPEWNRAQSLFTVDRWITDSVSIVHTITTPVAGGIISAREYYDCCGWKAVDDGLVSGGFGLSGPRYPVQKENVKGMNGPCGYIFTRVDGHPELCKLVWIINSDIGGWIPRTVIDKTISSTLMDFFNDVERQLEVVQRDKLRQRQRDSVQ